MQSDDVAEPCIHLANNAKEIYNCINGDDMCNALSLCVESESNLKQIKAWIIEKSKESRISAMKPSEKRRIISKRDAAKREAEKFEKQAEGKSQIMQSYLFGRAKALRTEEANCNFYLNNKMRG